MMRRMKKRQVSRVITNQNISTDAGVHQQPLNKSMDEEEKLLNTGSSMDMFLNVCDVFEKVLLDIEIDSYSKEVHDKLRSIEDAIQRKMKPFTLAQCGSDYGDLSSCRSLASSMQSLCSVTSEAALNLEDDLTFKQFLIKVNCPFCSESQADKVNLIRHLNYCKPFIFKTFKELDFMPYSVFQILPNNSFKCNVCPNSVQRNIKSNFVHAGTNHHISAYKSFATKKPFTEFFFCSCCKVLIPNNFTQLDIHINSKVHSSKSLKAVKVDSYLNKNVHCLYLKCKKFKCLICLLRSLFYTPEDIMRHFDDPKHLKALRQKHLSLGMIFCEFCSECFHSYELRSHFASNEHMLQEKIGDVQETFELCLYCGVMCKNLMELAAHMKENCKGINKLRNKDPELDKENKIRKQITDLEKLNDVMKQKQNNDKKIPEDGTKKRNVIIVKNNTEIPKLFRHFKGFGEIIAVEMLKEKNVLIEFKEKSAVDEILMLRDIIKMNDFKLEITTDEELKSEEKVRQRRVSFQNLKGGSPASEHERQDEKEDNKKEDTDDDTVNVEFQNDKFGELFQRVSGHLTNSTQKFNSDVHEILQDFNRNFGGCELTLVGFAGSGLSFSFESISLYTSNSVFEPDLFSMCKKTLGALKWTEVTYCELDPVPYVKAIHRDSKTVFKITERRSAKILTDILRYYQEENDVVKPFCLMIKFWFSVKELKIREFEYVIMSLLIFFLVNEKVVKPYPNIYTQVSSKAFIFETLMNDTYERIKDLTKNEEKKTYSVQELFMKFLHFLIKFDFNENSICAPVKHPIPRVDHKINYPMFIWDPLVEVNLAKNVSENDLKSLLDTVRGTVFK